MVTKRTNVSASTEGKVEAAKGITEARRKDENACTEVRNREEVPELMTAKYEKYLTAKCEKYESDKTQ